MDSTQVYIVDGNGGQETLMKVESAPVQIACAFNRVGDIERAMVAADVAGLA